jgi:hypothetical protein
VQNALHEHWPLEDVRWQPETSARNQKLRVGSRLLKLFLDRGIRDHLPSLLQNCIRWDCKHIRKGTSEIINVCKSPGDLNLEGPLILYILEQVYFKNYSTTET